MATGSGRVYIGARGESAQAAAATIVPHARMGGAGERLPVTARSADAGALVGSTSPDDVRRLFSRLSIRAAEGGGVRIEAPADAAASLAALFEGMASLLRAGSGRTA